MSDWYSSESILPSDDVEQPDEHSTDSAPPLREGLPPTYAMRHDRHYVDELSSTSETLPVRMLRVRDILMGEPVKGDLDGLFIESVRRVGILQPVLVRRHTTGYELIAGSKRLAAAMAAGMTELPCRVCDVDDREARELAEADDLRGHPDASRIDGAIVSTPSPTPALTPILTEVADRLDTALACWRMSTEHPKWPYAPTLATLTGIEIQCVKRLTDGLRLLTETPAVTKTTLDIAALVKDVCESTEPERRLVDVHLTCAVDPPVVQARGSDPLFRLGLASCLQGVAALVTEAPERTIHLAVRAERSAVNAVTLELSGTTVSLTETLVARFFDDAYLERPGGYGAAVALAVAKRVVDLHDGQVVVVSVPPAGYRVTLTIPFSHPVA